MIPSSWYRMDEIKGRDEELRRAAARHRDIGPLRRRLRLRRHDVTLLGRRFRPPVGCTP